MHDLSGGGVERMRLALIEQLRRRGMRVTLVVGDRGGALAPLLPHGLKVVVLRNTHMLGAIRPLARFLREDRPDVLVSSLDHNNVIAVLARLLSRAATRVVICQHNALSAERHAGWRYRVIPWLYWMLQTGTDGIVAVSQGVADDLAATAWITPHRITTIYNPVVGPDFDQRASGPAPHIWLNEPAFPAFVWAGRLTHQKDPCTLLEAMAILLRSRNVRLILLGDGPLRTDLEQAMARLGIADRVAFAGFQANPLPWIRHAVALVLTSRYEGLGNVIIEALACGTPVVATDCRHGPSEILQAGVLGRLVPVGDAGALAAALDAQLDAPVRPDALVARSHAFTAEACADAHHALFERILEGPSHVDAFGMRVSSRSAAEIVDMIMSETVADGIRLIVTPNLDHVRLLRRPGFAEACRSADIVCPDGLPVLLYARLRGLPLRARVTGCELFSRLAKHARLREQTVFLVLESAKTAAFVTRWACRLRLATCIRAIVAPPGLAADPVAQAALVDAIRAEAPTVLVMTLGAPQSEIFVHSHRDSLPPCWALCVGQAVRVELGLTERAPPVWQRFGLEWLWRIRQEPRRLVGRYVRAAAWFPIAVMIDLIHARRKEEGLLS